MTPAIFLVVLVATSNDPTATDKAAQAYAAQEHVGDALDAYYRVSFSAANRHKLGMLAATTEMLAQRKIVIKWEF